MKEFRRIYAIPDVHGRSDLLKAALELANQDGYQASTDWMVFTGDLIDRGPDSKGVIDTVKSLVDLDLATCLRGNHEDFAVDFYVKNRAHSQEVWDWNGGIQTRRSYPNGQMSPEHFEWLAKRPYSLELQGFFFSHAPVPREKQRARNPGVPIDSYTPGMHSMNGKPYNAYDLTWTYFGAECDKPGALFSVHEGPLEMNGTGSKHLIGVCGHIHRLPATQVRIFPNYRLLDAGCGCADYAPLAIHECISGRTLYAKPE